MSDWLSIVSEWIVRCEWSVVGKMRVLLRFAYLASTR
jgi:hypothetical protein